MFAGEVLLTAGEYFTGLRTYEQAAHDNIIDNDTAFAAVGITFHWAMTAVGVLAGVALVVLAVLAFYGQSWARAVSWIFGLPILLWYGALVVLHFLANTFAGDLADTDTGPAELARRYDEAWPLWLDTLDTVLIAMIAVLLIAALVCQTVPTADLYFQRQKAWR